MIRALALAALLAHPAAACTADAMVVFDASASMTAQGFGRDTGPRIAEARAAMARVLPQVQDLRRIGLVSYGRDRACDGAALHFRPLPRAAARIEAELATLTPGGLTPLTEATALAAAALRYRTAPAVIVLVTDGNESCGGAPCALADRLASEAADLTIHVLGFKVRWDAFASHRDRQAPFYGAEVLARCMADRTGGVYASTETEAELVEALRRVLGCDVVGGLHPARPPATPGA